MKKKKSIFTPEQEEELWKIISDLNLSQDKDSEKDAIVLGKEKIELLEKFVNIKESILYPLLTDSIDTETDEDEPELDLGDDSLGDFIEVCISKGKEFFQDLVSNLKELRKKTGRRAIIAIEDFIKEKCKDFISSPDEMVFSVLWQIDWDVVQNPMSIVEKYSKHLKGFKVPKNSKIQDHLYLKEMKKFISEILVAETIEQVKIACAKNPEYDYFRNLEKSFDEDIKDILTYNEYSKIRSQDNLFSSTAIANFISDVNKL